MTATYTKILLIVFLLSALQNSVSGQQTSKGFFDFSYHEDQGKIKLIITEDQLDQEFIYVNSLAAGVGSNDLGLDRGQLGNTRIVKFTRVADKIMLLQPNYQYRAISDNEEERKSVDEAFAQSVLWGFSYTNKNGSYTIEMADFLKRDAHNIASRLTASKEGTYKIDKSRSALYFPRTKNFPDNTEFESIITFTGSPKGKYLQTVTPTASAITVRMHHSFVRLPDNNYEPRVFDPRSGFFPITYQDYATPIAEPITKRFISRHRLKKKDPSAAVSEAIEPIIYYLDRGAPEPVRSALLDGARWWNEAFEAAGYRNAFQVKILPEGADPLDVRYNVIQWVHRSTRGWSYGASVRDPRTGEIIKGHVSLGSLRVRQDFLIAEGLLAPYKNNEENQGMMEMALARLRQLSAHEVGHTLGLAHNFAASYNDRASVMDYPHPQIDLDKNGNISLANAYATGIGEWDKITVQFGYGENTSEQRQFLLNSAFKQGFKYITDQDARPADGAHPYAHLWDNGKDAATELERLLKIRQSVLQNFSANQIKDGMPYSNLEEVLVPMYFLHRYQLEGAAKLVGGLDYQYAVKGGYGSPVTPVPASVQKNALTALINTITPQNLEIPEKLLQILPPRAFTYSRTRETFKSRTGVTFDAFSPAETITDVTLSFLLLPERMNRLLQQHAVNQALPSVATVLEKITDNALSKNHRSAYHTELQRIVARQTLEHIMALAVSEKSHSQVSALAHYQLSEITRLVTGQYNQGKDLADTAFYFGLKNLLEQFRKEPAKFKKSDTLSPPDGSPIGSLKCE